MESDIATSPTNNIISERNNDSVIDIAADTTTATDSLERENGMANATAAATLDSILNEDSIESATATVPSPEKVLDPSNDAASIPNHEMNDASLRSDVTIASSAPPLSPSVQKTTTPLLESPKQQQSHGTRALGTRPSPWREPRVTLPPPARDMDKHEKQHDTVERRQRRAQSQRRRAQRALSGTIACRIPLSVTADLGVAWRRGCARRRAVLLQQFPSLQEEPSATASSPSKPSAVQQRPKQQRRRHVPQPQEYASVLDYLEAKYVQGVVISDDMDDDEVGSAADGPDDEGQGSVYSETSFLDDTGLQRTIAEQVLGQATTTKLELMNIQDDDEDAAFFVNVGDLEVEETDLTQDRYDPLEDTDKPSAKKSRKRKKPAPESAASKSETAVPQGPPKKKEKSSTSLATKPAGVSKKKEKVDDVNNREIPHSKSSKTSKSALVKSEATKSKDLAVVKLQKVATTKRAEVDRLLESLEASIKALTEEELPMKPKPKRTRVVVKVPRDNKPGDMITFANPHIPGQKLKVKVPVNSKPGDTFKVTVPKPPDEEEEPLGDDGAAKDHNKFSRELYDELDAYARAYDDWCDAEGAYRKAIRDNSFSPHFMKRNKCNDIVSLFPTDTRTPITTEYLKKVIRRARQNKHKRELTLARQQQQSFLDDTNDGDENSSNDGSDSKGNAENEHRNDNSDEEEDDDEEEEEEMEKLPPSPTHHGSPKQVSKKAKPTRTAMLPLMSRSFPSKPFNIQDFMEIS